VNWISAPFAAVPATLDSLRASSGVSPLISARRKWAEIQFTHPYPTHNSIQDRLSPVGGVVLLLDGLSFLFGGLVLRLGGSSFLVGDGGWGGMGR